MDYIVQTFNASTAQSNNSSEPEGILTGKYMPTLMTHKCSIYVDVKCKQQLNFIINMVI